MRSPAATTPESNRDYYRIGFGIDLVDSWKNNPGRQEAVVKVVSAAMRIELG
jgi:hypothetical protein